MQDIMPDRQEQRALGGISENMSSCGLPMSTLGVHTAAENHHLSSTPYDEAEEELRRMRCEVSLLEDQRDRAVEKFCASPDHPELGRRILDLGKEIFEMEYHTINGFIGNIKLQNPDRGSELEILNFKERQSQAEARLGGMDTAGDKREAREGERPTPIFKTWASNLPDFDKPNPHQLCLRVLGPAIKPTMGTPNSSRLMQGKVFSHASHVRYISGIKDKPVGE